MIATLQNSVVSYNTLTLTYLLIVGIAAQLVGIFGFWSIQKRYKLSTKVMFNAVMVGILVLDGWGMIGICEFSGLFLLCLRSGAFAFMP